MCRQATTEATAHAHWYTDGVDVLCDMWPYRCAPCFSLIAPTTPLDQLKVGFDNLMGACGSAVPALKPNCLLGKKVPLVARFVNLDFPKLSVRIGLMHARHLRR